MNTKELIELEINQVPEENLEELYQIIKQFTTDKTQKKKTGVLSKLKQIKIQAPKDFSKNRNN